jgi:hypothetical protein
MDDEDGEVVEGTVVDLLERTPYLLAFGVVPPLHVLNDLLRRGKRDAGMSGGCRWEPFEIDDDEWAAARATLEAAARPCRYVPPPSWVTTIGDWEIWLFEHVYGVPADEHRRLVTRDAELQRTIAEAQDADDSTRVAELTHERTRVNDQFGQLLLEYLRRP